MESAEENLAYHALRLRIVRLRHELGCLGTVTGLGTPLLAVLLALVAGMIAVVALLVGGCEAPAGLLGGAILGAALGGVVMCGLMPVFDSVTAATVAAAQAKVDGIHAARAAEQQRIREFQEAEERREAYDRQAKLAATAKKTTAQAATAQNRGWGQGALCWYCGQRLVDHRVQCVYCRMLNETLVA
jgi:hypothetical protein